MGFAKLPGKRRHVVVRGRCIISGEDGRILIQEDAKTGFYIIPGGRLEYSENLPSCLLRELKEEAGITVKPERLVYIVEVIDDRKHEILFYFKCSYEGIPRSQNRYVKLAWKKPEEIRNKFWPQPLIDLIEKDHPDYKTSYFLVVQNGQILYINRL